MTVILFGASSTIEQKSRSSDEIIFGHSMTVLLFETDDPPIILYFYQVCECPCFVRIKKGYKILFRKEAKMTVKTDYYSVAPAHAREEILKNSLTAMKGCNKNHKKM